MRISTQFLTVFLIILSLSSCSSRSLEKNRALENFLKDSFTYTIDHEGDYRIISDGESLMRDVWIRGHINYSGTVGIREIFTFSSLLSPVELNHVSRVLLMDNLQTRVMGSWSLLKDSSSDQYLILYTVKAPLNAKEKYIYQAMREASEAAMIMERVLSPNI
jgi:hypothetical protein